MSWSDIKPWIAKIAPMLGTALGGPLGGAAGALVSSALGTKDATPESIEQAIKTGSLTGEQILALRQAEMQFQKDMEVIDIKSVQDLEALAVDDRKSARERQVKTGDITPQVLAYISLAVWGSMNGFLLYMAYMGRSLPVDMSPIIMRVLGTMDALMGMAFAFFFGTSASSRSKDQMIYNSTPTKE